MSEKYVPIKQPSRAEVLYEYINNAVFPIGILKFTKKDKIDSHQIKVVKYSKEDQDFTQLKQLANLISPTQALPKAVQVDGREIGDVPFSKNSSIIR
ncbi:MAG: hypothetical protein HWN65_04530 [Candidatus Helarchaeota archaeon]|nr:hypothetical protein [Candidatus Helarchaeota archaeon]